MPTPVTPFLMFQGKAEEVITDLIGSFWGGATFTPLGDYGFSRQFTWISDRSGVSWQLNLC
jgi:predicted 3-demethylubiquinone-9 3-methyltransferase (glyoxalase superfamily)